MYLLTVNEGGDDERTRLDPNAMLSSLSLSFSEKLRRGLVAQSLVVGGRILAFGMSNEVSARARVFGGQL